MFNYKAISANGKEWIFGNYERYQGKDYISYEHFSDSIYTYDNIEVIGSTLCIGSTMYDKNNQEIYTNDLVKLINILGDEVVLICRFGVARRNNEEGTPLDITGFYFESSDGRKLFPIAYNYLGKSDLEIMEVIGNTKG